MEYEIPVRQTRNSTTFLNIIKHYPPPPQKSGPDLYTCSVPAIPVCLSVSRSVVFTTDNCLRCLPTYLPTHYSTGNTGILRYGMILTSVIYEYDAAHPNCCAKRDRIG